jgi:uncharacterized membrane protein
MIQQLLWSLISRPYVTVLLVAFLTLSWREQGVVRTLVWFASGYLVALVAEWGSINHGVPFGWYVYRYDALTRDLVVFGVPFFDSVSFVFLSYISFSFAQFLLSPLRADGFYVRRFTPARLRNSIPVLVLGAVLMVAVDLVVDPLALLGKYWFLGEIYYYPEPGIHFGVPVANYLGWFAVALVIIAVNQRADGVLAGRSTAGDLQESRCNALYAPVLWGAIVLFQLGLTYWLALVGDSTGLDVGRVMLQALAGTLTVAPVMVLAVVQMLKPVNRGPSPPDSLHDE